MSWIIFIAVSIITSSLAVLLQRYIQRDSKLNPIGFYISSALISSCLIGILLIFRGFDTDFSQIPLANLALSTMLWGAANALVVHALRKTEASTFSILFTTRVLWSIAIAVIFLDEGFTIAASIGTILMLIGSVAAIYEKGSGWDRRGVILSLATAFFFGAAVANDGIVLSNGYDVPSYFLWAFLSPALVFAFFNRQARNDAVKILTDKNVNTKVAALSALYAISSMTLFFAFQSDQDLALLSSLNQTQTVLVVMGAMILLREREKVGQKIAGSILVVIGAVVLIL